MTEAGAILLAAGLSRRMGERNKLLLPRRGQPLVRYVARSYCAALRGPVTVVLGHEAEAVAHALRDLPVTLVWNPDYTAGQMTSLAAGLAKAPAARVLLIGLADQPLLTPADLHVLLAAHHAADPDRITIPVRGEMRGNPIVVPDSLRPRLTEDPDRPGCLRFTRDHPEAVQRLPLPSDGYYTDIDTPEAYDALCKADARGAA